MAIEDALLFMFVLICIMLTTVLSSVQSSYLIDQCVFFYIDNVLLPAVM